MTARIKKSERERIAKRAVDAALAERREALKEATNRAITLVVRELCDAREESSNLMKARQLPQTWIHTARAVSLEVDGRKFELVPHSGVRSFPLIPDFLFHGYKKLRSGGEAAKAAASAYDEKDAIRETTDHLTARVLGLIPENLNPRRLPEIWPEGEPFWSDIYEEAAPSGKLPMADPSEVNRLLGLDKLGISKRSTDVG